MDWKKLLNSDRLRSSNRAKDARNEFESDFGRIIFSAAMRRMHDKTQVFPLTTDDNIHSRLTHSMEVMSIGHSLGIRICENEDFQKIVGQTKTDLFREIPVILKNACLVHDIGNPPFGHFGETVIQNYFKTFFEHRENFKKIDDVKKEDFTLFDGNAQGFRVLTKLQNLNDKYGLNLTYSTLGAYLKYPNAGKKNKKKISTKKRGVFQSEIEYLKKVSENCGLFIEKDIIRHPLSYLMEASDTICYLVMDIEDGFNKDWYDFIFFTKYLENVNKINEKVESIISSGNTFGVEITKMVNLRIYLIQRLVDLVVDNFFKHYDSISKGEYQEELVFDDPTNLAKTLQNFCCSYVYPNREITSLELTGHSVLTGLLDYYIDFVFHKDENYRRRAEGLISNSILRSAYIENGLPESSCMDDLDDYYKLRVIVDFISGMTDQFALNQYQKLSGQKIN